jgi:DNA helicase-2/ATP-dependent DNA helicase PcrA
MSKIFEGLNDAQKIAVEATEGPLMIVAGAGAGKTKTITHRIMHLIEKGISPKNILAITFTNKAAKEMRERIDKMVPLYLGHPHVATFHALGVRMLREYASLIGRTKDFTIADQDDSTSMVKEAIVSMSLDPKEYEPRKIRAIISRQKGEFVTVEDYHSHADTSYEQIIASVWEKYEGMLTRNGALDFDDLLLKTVKLLKEHESVREKYREDFKYIHIDEYQDTNEVQYELVKLLVGKGSNICVVGDTDQNIYSWRGAQIKNMLHFEKDFPGAKIVFLEQNYRSTKTILKAANEVIGKNTVRVPKNLFTENEDGTPIKIFEAYDERDEAVFVIGKAQSFLREGAEEDEVAILYRANFQSRIFEEECLRQGVPYQVLGTKFYERKEIKDLLSYLKLSGAPDSFADLKRALAFPSRGIGKVTLAEILAGRRDTLPAGAKKKVDDFFSTISHIKKARETMTASEVIKYTLSISGIESALKTGGPEELERLENLKELVTLATRYDEHGIDGITRLLDDASLASEQDGLIGGSAGVRLMTVHAAKGLEFKKVFIVGLEHGLFPHERHDAQKKEDQEEERRLFYVALTRAKDEAILSYARSRMLFGSRDLTIPSEFLYDIPSELTEALARRVDGLLDDDKEEGIVFFD